MAAPDLSPCAELVRQGDPDRFLSALTAPEEMRERLFALYAFNLEVARIPAVVSEPMLGEIRLQWWREAIEQIYACGPVRRHEVVEPLADAARDADLPRAPFDALLDARAFDIYDEPFADRVAFDAYLEATGGGLMELSARALAPDLDDVSILAVRDVGFAAGAAGLLRALPALVARGKAPLPENAISSRNALVEGEANASLSEIVNAIARDALTRLRAAKGADINKSIAPALRAAWRSEHVLILASNMSVDPFRDIGEESQFRRRAGLIWRAARGTW